MAKVISIRSSGNPPPSSPGIADEIKKAEGLLKSFPGREVNYNRLMILYRRAKYYKKELALIEKGIKVFTHISQPKAAPSKKVILLSKKINKAFELVDAEGNQAHIPEPLLKWKKRKEVVLKKLSQQ